MAKDQFIRSKPHVNVMLKTSLVQQGFTTLGAHQIAHGLMVTNPNDRHRIAETLARATREPSEMLSFTFHKIE